MALSRNRIKVNGTTLNRARTFTFERQVREKECRVNKHGKTVCLNENRKLIGGSGMNKWINPKNALPTKRDKFKGLVEIEPECFVDNKGNRRCFNDRGQAIKTKSKRGDRGIFNIEKYVGSPYDKITKAPDGTKVSISVKDKIFNFILDNENKARAAIVVGDLLSLTLTTVGGITLFATGATGVGAAIGGAIIAGGAAVKGGTELLESATDQAIKSVKAIEQLEDVVEVAKQTFRQKVDRQDFIDKNIDEINKRDEELQLLTKTELKNLAFDLEMSGVSSLVKADLAREIAIQEVIGDAGVEVVEPRIGRSLLRSLNDKVQDVAQTQLTKNEDIREVMNVFAVNEKGARKIIKKHDIDRLEAEAKKEKEKKRKDSGGRDIEDIKDTVSGISKEQRKIIDEADAKVDELMSLLDIDEEQARDFILRTEADKAEADRLKEKKRLDDIQIEFDRIMAGDIIDDEEDEEKKSEEDKDFTPGEGDEETKPDTIGLDDSEVSDEAVEDLIDSIINGDEAPLPPNLSQEPLSPKKKKSELESPEDFLKKKLSGLDELKQQENDLLDELDIISEDSSDTSLPLDLISEINRPAQLDIESVSESFPVIDDDSILFSDPNIQSPSDFLLSQLEEEERQLDKKKFDFDISSESSERPIVSNIDNKKKPDFKFTEISNKEIINGASRAKLQKAMKTDLLDKPKNFTNPKNLTAEQTRGASGGGTLDNQKAAVVNNNPENIYNKIVRELTASNDCRAYLSNNSAKIALLPSHLKDELRNYCNNIMDDDS